MDADIKDLLAAGSSLGGARPKASVRDEAGCLCIAKFPKVDEDSVDDVGAWEYVALQLMSRCGIERALFSPDAHRWALRAVDEAI